MSGYDIIGDVHGHAFLLERLLSKLGYKQNEDSFFHPYGRKIIFLGDLINRGPDSVKVLKIVQKMVLQKQAYCVLGNHEFHLLQKFVSNPALIESKFLSFIPWIQTLPFFLEFPEFRVVHAAWHFSSIKKLKKQNVQNEDFIKTTMRPDSEFKKAIQNILQGIRVPIPPELSYKDRFGIKRKRARIRWWEKKKKYFDWIEYFPSMPRINSNRIHQQGGY